MAESEGTVEGGTMMKLKGGEMYILCVVTEFVNLPSGLLYETLKIMPVVHMAEKQWRSQEVFSGGSTNSVEDRGQIERGSGGGSPLVRGSDQFC
jgi:hypothetical protein